MLLPSIISLLKSVRLTIIDDIMWYWQCAFLISQLTFLLCFAVPPILIHWLVVFIYWLFTFTTIMIILWNLLFLILKRLHHFAHWVVSNSCCQCMVIEWMAHQCYFNQWGVSSMSMLESFMIFAVLLSTRGFFIDTIKLDIIFFFFFLLVWVISLIKVTWLHGPAYGC